MRLLIVYFYTESDDYRKDEAVAMLKRFYDGVNPNAPNPKVKGVRVNKVKSDVDDLNS